jgi:hypothetical protein
MDRIVRIVDALGARCLLCDAPAAWSVWTPAVGEREAVALCRVHGSSITRERRVFESAAALGGWPAEPSAADDEEANGEDWERLLEQLRPRRARPTAAAGVARERVERQAKAGPRGASRRPAVVGRLPAAGVASELRAPIDDARRRIRATARSAAEGFAESSGRPGPDH